MDLLARRESVKNRLKVLCSVPGSGWHKNDANDKIRTEAGEMPVSERIVALQDDGRICIVGPDVAVVLAGLAEYVKQVDPFTIVDQIDKQAFLMARRVVEEEKGDAIRLHTQDWNCCNWALRKIGIQAIITDAKTPQEGEE